MIRLLIFLFTLVPLLAHSSIKVNGNFSLSKTCPAYLSKNKKTNPDNLIIRPGQHFVIREVNRPIRPQWLRIEIPTPTNSLRWVQADCGEANYQPSAKVLCNQAPGHADSYVLALSWQPAFCQTHGYEAGKPECKHLAANSYQATHLVLHGLWPNQDGCGEQYNYCGVAERFHHCDYKPVLLNPYVANNLRQMMPSYAYGGCLERYEWNKHGSCQIRSSDDYFSLAIRLSREANQTALGQFLHEQVGKTVKRAQLRKMIRASFGQEASRKVYLGCKNGLLMDVYIQLPAAIPQQESLQNLLKKAPDFNYYDACLSRIGISDFSNQIWY